MTPSAQATRAGIRLDYRHATHCQRGHLLTDSLGRNYSTGYRVCVYCRRDRDRIYKQRSTRVQEVGK